MRSISYVMSLSGLLVFSSISGSDETPSWVSDGPYVDEQAVSLQVPVETLANKLIVEVEVNGAPQRFVLDTGSPSMLSADIASELGLEIVDQARGRDAHGAIVESGIAQVDLAVGDTTFHKVPIFVTDLSSSKAHCLWDGVLGSEVLPMCAWQIDLPDSVLRCESRLKQLDHVKGAKKQHLYDFGYPHAPFLDVRFARQATSKAMFDTGSPEYFAISPPDFEGAQRNDAIGGSVTGDGSIGTSAGGPAPRREQRLVDLKALTVGNVQLGHVDAVVREAPPSLIGAPLLEHFVVTLDMQSETAYFDEYREAPFVRSTFGFSPAFGDTVTVALVWDDSPAAAAGLEVGQQILAINGEPTDTSCAGMRKVLRSLAVEDTIELEWAGGSGELTRTPRTYSGALSSP